MDFCDECGELVENISHACLSDQGNKTVDSSSTSETAEKEPSQSAENNLDEIKVEWEREQIKIRKKCCVEDCHDWSKFHITEENEEEFSEMEPLKYIGGVDISFVKGDDVNACAAFVVLSFPDLKVIYEDLSMVQLTAPYIAGYLAFREADFLVEKIEKLRKNKPEIMPQVIAVDGNGILHPRRCGLATHLGVLVDTPCYGIAKNLFHVDGLEKNEEHMSKIQSLEEAGDTFLLHTTDGELLGKALRAVEGSTNPVYISAGHKISLDTCVWLTQKCSKKRIPEPTRQADLRSREYLRQQFLPSDPKQQKKQKPQKPKVPHKDANGGNQETNGENTAKEPAETSELETAHPKPDKGRNSDGEKPSDVKPKE